MATCPLLLPMENKKYSLRPCLVVLIVLLAIYIDSAGCSPRMAVVGRQQQQVDDEMMMERFQRWKVEYNRSYATAWEERHRFQVYATNMRYIEARNGEEDPSYELGETEYTDLSTEEFMAMYTMATLDDGGGGDDDDGGVETITTRAGTVHGGGAVRLGGVHDVNSSSSSSRLPAHVDWRDSGAVTEVKAQGACGTFMFMFCMMMMMMMTNYLAT